MRLRLTFPLMGIAFLLCFSGCKEDEEGAVRITFKGTFGNDPLVMEEPHDYVDGQRIQFSKSEFFISDLRLVQDGNTWDLSDIELVDLSFDSIADAAAGVSFTFPDVPAGDYTDLEFGIGVSPDLNTTKPSDYPSSSPLSSTARYWIPWSSYIFSKTEGRLDTLDDGIDNADLGFAYHTGKDDLYLNIRLQLPTGSPIRVTDDGTARVTFYLDHQKLMGLPDNALDIKAKPQNHNPEDIQYLQAILDNVISGALTYTID